ncbi:MAG: hypothetical protein ACYC5G_05475 [Candidatus Doudnabacteria bacterium]
MLIARTLEESEAFIDQELSHVVCLNKKPTTVIFNNFICLVDNENQKLVYFPERNEQRVIKTKKYGSLVLFDRIKDLLDSKFNKGILAVYCGSVSSIKRKRTTNVIVELSTELESYSFEDKEFGNAGGLYMNNIEGIEPQNAFFIVIERNRFTQNGVQIIDNFKLKTKN